MIEKVEKIEYQKNIKGRKNRVHNYQKNINILHKTYDGCNQFCYKNKLNTTLNNVKLNVKKLLHLIG